MRIPGTVTLFEIQFMIHQISSLKTVDAGLSAVSHRLTKGSPCNSGNIRFRVFASIKRVVRIELSSSDECSFRRLTNSAIGSPGLTPKFLS